ncbi:3-oxoacyl-[acyl-carrier-protein] reductase [Melghirimyces algeriensis]|uniref:3-oxoacyl-[acyl-carrier-protein] reductase n=2 Tax=Melghirimyces algeriensis TaxID=910412 RepID=A0A521AK40_9BACL|nr:3-oxoacyl-[acyl-carrier-protein] reductase [Melghirimyces algeriensis]
MDKEREMGRLAHRVAMITGAGRGIGKEVARRMGHEGARIVMLDMDEEALYHSAKELESEGIPILFATMDVTDPNQVESTVEETVEHFGRLDILVNNAGVIRDNLLYKMSDEDWETVMDVHLKGSFYCSRAVQKYMVEQEYGRIINLSSLSALGNRGQVNYSTAKAGLQGFTKTLAIELGKFGITVNAVAPGIVESDMTRAVAERRGIAFEDFAKEIKKEIPVQRIGQPEDIANAVLFFAEEAASFVNGQVLYVTGGPTV